uniref:Uncharacterized protein n=1 Tax=Ditylenchus dipsaci TaxID=166011 RepID=A0A915DSS9_9BILA
MSARDRREDGEIDSSEDIKNVRKISNYNSSHEEPRDVKPDLSSINNGKTKNFPKARDVAERNIGAVVRALHPHRLTVEAGPLLVRRLLVALALRPHPDHLHPPAAARPYHMRRIEEKGSILRWRKMIINADVTHLALHRRLHTTPRSRSKLSTAVVQKKEVGVQVPHYLIKELLIERGNMSASAMRSNSS